MKTKILVLLLGTFALSVLAAAHPIIIRHDREDAAYRKLGAEYAGALCEVRVEDGRGVRTALGTLIAPRWVLTAAHVARGLKPGHAIRFQGQDYPVAHVMLQPKWKGQEHDIALIYLQMPVEGAQPLPLYRWDDEAGQQIIFVGNGGFGNGETGPVKEDGVIRGATNRVNEVAPAWLNFVFNAPDSPGVTDLEGISGPGDSGGPGILLRDGTPYLAGVSSGQDSGPVGGKPGRYGVIEYYTRVSQYMDWIDQMMEAGANQDDAPHPGSGLQVTREVPPQTAERGDDECDVVWDLSDSPVGQAAAALLSAVCQADEEAHRVFIETHMAPTFRDQFPMEEHLNVFSMMHADLGLVEVVEVEERSPHEAQFVVQSKASGQRFSLMLEVDPAPPHQVVGVGIEPGEKSK